MNRISGKSARPRRPLWLPASGFYVLALAVTLAVFFVVWGLLQENGEEMPWVAAGLTASVVLSGAVLLREVIFRRARNRLLERQRQLDRNLTGLGHFSFMAERPDKLTIERNSAILREIGQKSEAARVLGTMASGHKEVVEMCERYLAINNRELARIGSGSPRLAPLLRGREVVEDLHRYHTLRRVEIEAKSLGNEARLKTKATEKIKVAGMALSIVESALKHYPEESKLTESAEALNEFIATVKVSAWIEKAEKAAFRGNYKTARKHYKDALFFIGHHHPMPEGHELAVARISEELEKINQIEA